MGSARVAAGDCPGTKCLGVSRGTAVLPHPAYPQHHCPRGAPKAGSLPTCGMSGWCRGCAVPVSVPTALPGHHKCCCSLLASFPVPTESVLLVGTALSTATHCTAHAASACSVRAVWALPHTRPAAVTLSMQRCAAWVPCSGYTASTPPACAASKLPPRALHRAPSRCTTAHSASTLLAHAALH